MSAGAPLIEEPRRDPVLDPLVERRLEEILRDAGAPRPIPAADVRPMLESLEDLLEQLVYHLGRGDRLPRGYLSRAQGLKARISRLLLGE